MEEEAAGLRQDSCQEGEREDPLGGRADPDPIHEEEEGQTEDEQHARMAMARAEELLLSRG